MKKALTVVMTLLFVASVTYAAEFAPTIMTITCPAEVEYQFDGSGVDIDINVAGKAAAMWLVINTKDQGDAISDVRNGFLGWHYVNGIDTTVYVSSKLTKGTGDGTVNWDGTDQDGNDVVAGSYDYYLWGYDDQTPRQLATAFVMVGFDWEAQFTSVIEKGEDGLPLAVPMFFGTNCWWFAGETYGRYPHGTTFKWALGGDPNDETFLQTTHMNIYTPDNVDFSYGGPALDPNDYSTYYQCCVNFTQLTNTMFKWSFVTDGTAIVDEDWLGWDELTWEDKGCAIGVWSQKPSVYTDGEYLYAQSPGLHQKQEEWNRLRCVTFDGEVVFDKMMHDWYMPDDNNPHDYINGSFHLMYSRTPYNWFLLSHTSCLHQMIDTTRLVDDADDEDGMVMFSNANGDYFMDSAYDPAVEPAWYCLADDKTTAMRRESITIDSNGFNIIGTGYYGLVSFGVSTQDGTGIANMQFADDTISDDAHLKGGGLLSDNGSSYDGLYYCGPLTADTAGWTDAAMASAWYVAFDSAGGVITDSPGTAVEDDAQAAFAVAQNSPNPFNPTTTIGFTTPDAGFVAVDVFNVAGQKVDTLVNDHMSAGTHSVVWDASGYSNGVYFYTIKSGDFSRTMKMTLLK